MAGMRLHDVAKPFFLGGKRHAPVGFLLLTGNGRTTEAIYALWHHVSKIGLEKAAKFLLDWYGLHKSGAAVEVPAWIFLAPWLDQLTASTYSGATRDPKSSHIWSFQNPFSRLPRLEKVKTYGNKDKLTTTQEKLWQEVGLDQVCSWQEMNAMAEKFDDSASQQKIKPKLANQADLLKNFLTKHDHQLPARLFPERTYPTANDTALLEHGRLTAALAFVVGGNIILQRQHNCQPKVTITNNADKVQINGADAAAFDWQYYKKLVLEHLNAYLIRISFCEYENLFHQAFRLDDIHGVRHFLASPNKKRLLARFKEYFHQEIGALFGPDQKVAPALEPLNDFPFDLVYLLPAALEEKRIKNGVAAAYKQAAETMAKDLQDEYRRDFKLINDIPDLNQGGELQTQLQVWAPYCFLEKIAIPFDASRTLDDSLAAAKRALAEQGLAAYKHLWQSGQVDREEAGARINLTASNAEAAEAEICEVCGLHRVFGAFYEKYEELLRNEPEKARIMEKVIHHHKEEPEKLCCACLARRLWSHGVVQEAWLSQMLKPEEIAGKVLIHQQINTLLPPPKLWPCLEIDKEGELPEDMGAAFVRWRRGCLQVYPTLAAATDADGNLALVYLTAHWQSGILAELSQVKSTVDELCRVADTLKEWSAKFDKIKRKIIGWHNNLSSEELSKLSGAIDDCECDLARFEAALLEHVAGLTSKDVQNGFRHEAVTARPHLARVLTRIRWVDEFFQDLPKILIDEGGIRTLTLEAAFPRLVVTVPAADLIRALRVIHYALAHNLFSSTLYGEKPPCPPLADLLDEAARRRREELSLNLLERILPPVLLGAVVIFKERQPLYHILTTARQVTDCLAQKTDPYPGVLLGLTDWRQCLGAMTQEQAEKVLAIDFCDLYHLLDNEPFVSRRPLFSSAKAATSDWGQDPRFFQALLAIKQARQGWPDRTLGLLKKKKLFDSMVYLKAAAKT